MSQRMDSSEIEELAGQWLARRDRADWSANDETDLQAWLAQSTAHIVAFVRLDAAWKQAKRFKALSSGVPAGEVPSPEEWQLTPFFDNAAQSEMPGAKLAAQHGGKLASSARSKLFRAIAASVILAVAGSVAWYMWPNGPDYSTPLGGLASVPMTDGSKVTLNTDSAIRVAMTDTERSVELQKGEAFFEVAKDP